MKVEPKYIVAQDDFLKTKLDQLVEFANEKRESKPDEAIQYAEEGIEIAKEIEAYSPLLELMSVKASALVIRGSFDQAKECCSKIIELGNVFNIQDHKSTALHILGYSYARRGLYQVALEYYYQAVQINLERNAYKAICENYNNIATIYKRINQLDKSLSYLEKSLEFYVKSGDELPYHYLANKAGILGVMQKYEEAIELLLDLLSRIENDPKQRFMQMTCYFGLANQYVAKNDVENAKVFFEKGIAFAKESNYRELLVRLYFRYGKMLFSTGKVEKATELLASALEYCEEEENQVLRIDCLKLLHQCYEEIGDYHGANASLKELVDLQEAHFQKDRDLKISEIEEEKELEIKTLINQKDEIERKNTLLEQSIKQLKQYAYIVAHDLKQPLRSINGFAQLIGKKLNQEGNETNEIGSYIEHLSSSTNYLNDLLEDLLQYATLEEFTNFDTAIDVNDVVNEVMRDFEREHVTFKVEKLPIIKVSKIHLKLLLHNLIDNAIKFNNKEECIINIDVSTDKKIHTFSITDNGTGIALAYHEKIFNVFYRIEKTKEGTGIGLAICDKIAELYGGKIWVESEAGKGSTFKFTIPENVLED